jgi:glycosyltransferase involved in cell wall biosynthesis
MRILHIIPSFSGGGAERQLVLLAREHAANGVDVAIIYHSEGPNLAFLEDGAVTLFPISLHNNYDPLALWKIVRTIRRWQPDIIQTWLPQMDILGGIAARLTGVPHILSERASAQAYGLDWKSKVRAAVGRRAHAIIANSHTGARYWQELSAACPIHVIVNAVTPFKACVDDVPVRFPHPAILYAGRIADQKNLKNLVAGLGIALDREPTAHAYILGTGHREADLQQWIACAPAKERIHTLGYVENLHPWYSNADVFVSVSDFEGHPNVVLEAASIGCPLVLSDIPEHREAIPPTGALFVDGHDPVLIAKALLECLSDKAGSEKRAIMSKQSVAELSVENQAAKYLDIYRRLPEYAVHAPQKRQEIVR